MFEPFPAIRCTKHGIRHRGGVFVIPNDAQRGNQNCGHFSRERLRRWAEASAQRRNPPPLLTTISDGHNLLLEWPLVSM